jgi:ppGpp synthetase/RelA/SpoT-type nucleotidyltranferase
MTLPVSKTALDRLGSRLAADEQVSESDRVTLAQVAGAYQQAVDAVKAQLETLGYAATTRVKTTGTLVEKLRREAPMRLSQMQDLAGARIVLHDRSAQDSAVRLVCEDWETGSRRYRVIDRRDRPSYGYRAVHILLAWDQLTVEVQIRTELQDVWAQMMERLADRWGRGIRYGEDPNGVENATGSLSLIEARQGLVSSFIVMSDLIAQVEIMRAKAEVSSIALDGFKGALDSLQRNRADDDSLPITEIFSASALDIIIEGVERLSPEARAAMNGARSLVFKDFIAALQRAHTVAIRRNEYHRENLHGIEDKMQSSLQMIADRAERGEI